MIDSQHQEQQNTNMAEFQEITHEIERLLTARDYVASLLHTLDDIDGDIQQLEIRRQEVVRKYLSSESS